MKVLQIRNKRGFLMHDKFTNTEKYERAFATLKSDAVSKQRKANR